MRNIMMRFSVAGLLVVMALIGGCGGGDGGSVGGGSVGGGSEKGYAIKGPVTNATVTYSDGTTSLTGADGSFPYKGLAITCTGGTYMDVDNLPRQAPDMAAPAGMRNLTPLTTLYYYADTATRSKLTALVAPASIDTVVVGTITGETNVLAAKLNESLGELLTQIKDHDFTPTPAYLAGLATQVATLTPATALLSASIVAAVKANTVAAPIVINTDAVSATADKTKEGSAINPITPVNVPVIVDVTVTDVLVYDASLTSPITFNVHPTTTFAFNVIHFAAGDKLVFDAGTAISIINLSGTDGVLDVVGSKNGKAVSVHLTGIAEASDAAIFGGSSFSTAFGTGALLPTDAANVSVTTANTEPGYDASTAAVKLAVHPTTTFTYNVANFAVGDKLLFDDGTAISLINTSGTDGTLDVVGSLNGQAVTVHLTGIAAASDGAIFGVNSFNTVFGFGSLVLANGDVVVQPSEVSVTLSNATPYDASTAVIVFNVHPTVTFTYNIAKFSAGDKLVFDDGTAISLINTSGTDGTLDAVGSLNGQAVTVHLTGIAAASDGAIFGVNSFNTVFGFGSLVTLQ